MSTAVFTEWIAEASPLPRARITGVVYFLYFLTAIFGMLWLLVMGVNVQRWKEQASATVSQHAMQF
jgi:hypothetical protein